MKINSYQSTIPISIEARSIVFLFFFLLLVIPLHDNLSHQESYQPLAQPSGFLLLLPLYSVTAKIKISWHIFFTCFLNSNKFAKTKINFFLINIKKKLFKPCILIIHLLYSVLECTKIGKRKLFLICI